MTGKKYVRLVDAMDEDLVELAALAKLELGPDDHFDPRPLTQQARPVEQRAADWVDRGVDRDCAIAVLDGSMRPTPAAAKVAEWQASGKPWLRLQGGRGVGKSWAAGAWLMTGKPADALQVEGAETVGWAEWDKRWPEMITIPRLVIDDPDIEDGKPKMWYSVLAPRLKRRLPTVITTNAVYDRESGHNAFWVWWGAYRDRMESRFAEIGMAKQLSGEDMRRERLP